MREKYGEMMTKAVLQDDPAAGSPIYRLTRGIQFPNKTIPLKTPVLRGISIIYDANATSMYILPNSWMRSRISFSLSFEGFLKPLM